MSKAKDIIDRNAIPCYTGVAECGCIVAAQVDDPADRSKRTDELIEFMQGCIESGLTVGTSTVGALRGGAFGHKCGLPVRPMPKGLEEYGPGVKLWRCTCEVEVMIASEIEPGEYEIQDAAVEEARDNSSSVKRCRANMITTLAEIPKHWIGSLPRGLSEDNPDDLYCEKIVENMLALAEKAALARPMPNQTSIPFKE